MKNWIQSQIAQLLVLFSIQALSLSLSCVSLNLGGPSTPAYLESFFQTDVKTEFFFLFKEPLRKIHNNLYYRDESW